MDRPGFDIIGDVHGQGPELDALLWKMDYRPYRGAPRHPYRKAIFTNDLFDRGRHIPYVVEVAKRMEENGDAKVVASNHDYNHYVPGIVCPDTPLDEMPQRYRHSHKHYLHTTQQYAALNDGGVLLQQHLRWLRTRPLFYETPDIRVAHAYWNADHIALLKQRLPGGILTDEDIREVERNFMVTPFSRAVLETLKGPKIDVEPLFGKGLSPEMFQGSTTRRRIAWWHENSDDATIAVRDLFPEVSRDITARLPYALVADAFVTDHDPRPVFFGHYCLVGAPYRTASRSQCTDFGVMRAGGHLAAYRYNWGDKALYKAQFVSVPRLAR